MQKRVMTSALVALGLHFVVFASWVTLVALDFPMSEPVDAAPQGDPEMTVVLNTFIETPEVEPPIPALEKESPKPTPLIPEAVKAKVQPDDSARLKVLPKQESRFANTSAEQAGTPDADTNIIGERNTRAASEMAPTLGAPEDLPSQDGRPAIHPAHLETVSQKYQEGSLGGDDQGGETERPQYATAGASEAALSTEKTVETIVTETKAETAEDQYLREGAMIAKLKKEIEEERKAKEAAQKKAQESVPDRSKKESELAGNGTEVEQELKKDAFSGYTAKTRVTGSISRSGKSALNVKNSPLGRYQALVSKAVELQWRRNCDQHRDHIVPGVISLRFYVDKAGAVSGIKFQDVVGANYIERGFTQRAIRQAKLPKMPSDVLKELKGDPLELIYNFSF